MIINAKTRKWIEWNIVELLKEDKVHANEKIEIIAEDIMGIFEEGISEMSDEGLGEEKKFVEVKPGYIINIDMIESVCCYKKCADIYFTGSNVNMQIDIDEYEKLKSILKKENENGCS